MSEETTQITPGETATITGEGTVTTDGDLQTTVTEPVAPVTDPVEATPVPEVPVVDPVASPVEAPVDSQPPVEQPVVEVIPPVLPPEAQAIADGPDKVVVVYNGKEVVKRFGLFDADGAEECELADGSTAFVPKSVLGE